VGLAQCVDALPDWLDNGQLVWVGPLLLFVGGFVVLRWSLRASADAEWERRRRMAAARKCAHCGYDLRASKGRCPECGTDIPL
jgi:hypothetical protein